jgi:hypothetical protein
MRTHLSWLSASITLLTVAFGMTIQQLASATPAAAQGSVGIYSDNTGLGCSLSDLSSGVIVGYVVVRPGPNGASAVEFSAPKPPCFTATYLTESTPPSMLSIGNTQTGVSIAMVGCFAAPTHVLTIQYLGTGTTPTCCEFPVIPDPIVSDVIIVDCAFNEEASTGLVSTINADASCACQGNSPPDAPFSPLPMNGATNVSVFTSLSWSAYDIDFNLAEFDVYLGTAPSPPLVATVTEPTYEPGP